MLREYSLILSKKNIHEELSNKCLVLEKLRIYS